MERINNVVDNIFLKNGKSDNKHILNTCSNVIEQSFLDNVTQTVTSISSPRFKKIHEAKAISNTWLAWQKNPDHGFYSLFREGLIDEDHINYRNWYYR